MCTGRYKVSQPQDPPVVDQATAVDPKPNTYKVSDTQL